MGIKFYYQPGSPPCQAIWMLLKELGLEYEAILVDVLGDEHRKDTFKAISPRMRVPAMEDGDFCLGESRAIAVYLCKKYEQSDKKYKLYPTGFDENAKFNAILFGDLDNYWTVLNYLDIYRVLFAKGTGPMKDLLPNVQQVLKEVDDLVEDKTYIFGEHLTLLDFFVLATVSFLELSELEFSSKYHNLQRWKAEMEKLSYYDECVGKPTKDTIAFYKYKCQENQS